MKSLSATDTSELKGVEGLLFDLDDTFVDHQGILAEAYEALWALQRSGYRLIALTGRPASWCEPLPRLWPIEGAIAENGAVAYLKRQRRVVFHDSISIEERKARRRKLDQLSAAIQLAVPELMPADDVQGRISDYTFDIGEFHQAREDSIQRATAIGERAGALVTRSSVHLHFSFDRWDKASGALHFLSKLQPPASGDQTAQLNRWAFIGDSQNDATAFSAFRLSCGVANLHGQFSLPPSYRCTHPRGLGFVEFSQALISAKSA